MGISELCIRRPVMTILLMASIMLAGFIGYRQLPIAAIPRIEVPTIQVSARLPGGSPYTMAVSIASPLERQVLGELFLEHLVDRRELLRALRDFVPHLLASIQSARERHDFHGGYGYSFVYTEAHALPAF